MLFRSMGHEDVGFVCPDFDGLWPRDVRVEYGGELGPEENPEPEAVMQKEPECLLEPVLVSYSSMLAKDDDGFLNEFRRSSASIEREPDQGDGEAEEALEIDAREKGSGGKEHQEEIIGGSSEECVREMVEEECSKTRDEDQDAPYPDNLQAFHDLVQRLSGDEEAKKAVKDALEEGLITGEDGNLPDDIADATLRTLYATLREKYRVSQERGRDLFRYVIRCESTLSTLGVDVKDLVFTPNKSLETYKTELMIAAAERNLREKTDDLAKQVDARLQKQEAMITGLFSNLSESIRLLAESRGSKVDAEHDTTLVPDTSLPDPVYGGTVPSDPSELEILDEAPHGGLEDSKEEVCESQTMKVLSLISYNSDGLERNLSAAKELSQANSDHLIFIQESKVKQFCESEINTMFKHHNFILNAADQHQHDFQDRILFLSKKQKWGTAMLIPVDHEWVNISPQIGRAHV